MAKKPAYTKSEPLWKDRKHTFLGLPWSFTKYSIDDERLYVESGFFKSELNEILLYRILDVKSTQSFGQKLFGIGTIILYSADQSNRTLELKSVKHPRDVHRFISEIVEKERVQHGIAGRELTGAASHDMDHMDGFCDEGDHGVIPPMPPHHD